MLDLFLILNLSGTFENRVVNDILTLTASSIYWLSMIAAATKIVDVIS